MQLLIVTLTVTTTQSRNYVVLDDPLPAGFEVIDPLFQTASSVYAGSLSGYRWRYPFTRTEYYDDRVNVFADRLPAGLHRYSYLVRSTTVGTFVVPPARAEGMYEPEVFGQTATARITVR